MWWGGRRQRRLGSSSTAELSLSLTSSTSLSSVSLSSTSLTTSPSTPLHSAVCMKWKKPNLVNQISKPANLLNNSSEFGKCLSGLFRNLCWLSRALGFSSDNCTIVMKTRTFNGWKKSNSNFDSIAKECQMKLLLQSFKQNQKFPSESSLFLWPLWLQLTLLSLWHHCCDCHYRDCDHQW